MCSTREKILLCSKTHLTLGDVVKILNSSYKSVNPEWKKLKSEIQNEGKIIGKYGIKAQRVLKHFEIDVNQLIQMQKFEKKG